MSHAIISPSGFKALMLCPGKPYAEKGRADNANENSAEGTAAHELAASLLQDGGDAAAFVGRIFEVEGFKIEATSDFCEAVQVYVDAVRERVCEYEDLFGATVELRVEQKVPIWWITGEEGATGTADAIIVATLPNGSTMLDVWDLKFGRGVEVSAQHNEQLMMYAAGALDDGDLRRTIVRMMIHQPRIRKEPSEFELKASEVVVWARDKAAPAAQQALNMYKGNTPPAFNPGESQCRFCKAKADCKALEHHVAGQITEAFADLDIDSTSAACEKVSTIDPERLGRLFPQLDLIDGFIRAVRARIEQVMFDGGTVPGVKLVQGKRGNRRWADEMAAETLCKKFRLRQEEMYDMKLASPTQIEKLLKESPRRWVQLEPLITRNEGKLGVASMDDPREAVVVAPVADSFVDVSTEDLL